MSQKSITFFINEIYSKPPKKKYATIKTNDYHIDVMWSLEILDLKDYGSENKGGYKYVLVIFEMFSNFGFTIPLKNKDGQTITDSFKNILKSSKRKPNLIETDRGKELYNNIFQNFPNNNNFKHFSRNTYSGAVFAQSFNLTVRNLLERGEAIWIDVLPAITKQYINRVYSSPKLTPIQASLKKNEGFVYNNLLDKRKNLDQNIK